MISCKIFFPINGNSFLRKTKLIVIKLKLNPLHFTVVLGLYLKQHLFLNKLQKISLEPCLRLVTNVSPSLMFLAL